MTAVHRQFPNHQQHAFQQGARSAAVRGGSISKAAPVMQAAIRRERLAKRRRRIFTVIGILALCSACLAAAKHFYDQQTASTQAAQTQVSAPPPPQPIASAPAKVRVEKPAPIETPTELVKVAKTPQEFVNRAQVNGVRLSGRQSRAIINGSLYNVGDVVAPELGLVFVGHDPDGEYLLFRDPSKRTVFLRVHKRS